VQADAVLQHLSAGRHRLSYRNSHRRDISVYLANALVPENDRVAITAQTRDIAQRDLVIDFTLHDDVATSFAPVWVLACIAAAAAVKGLVGVMKV
jgi:hypothetical protein